MESARRFDAVDFGDDAGGDRGGEVGKLGAGTGAEFEDGAVGRGDKGRDGGSFVLGVRA